MATPRRPGALAGAMYLLTHVTSVGAVILYGPMLDDDRWSGGTGSGLPQQLGALSDVVLAVAVVGTAVALFPHVRRRSETGAMAYVGLRVLEASIAAVGAVLVIAAVQMRAAGEASVAAGLVEAYRWAFFVGPGLVVGFHTTILAAVLLRHRLVPAWITWLGLAGAPLVTASNLLIFFGREDQVSVTASLAAVPIFAWEVSLALFLLIKGLRLPRVDQVPAAQPAVGQPAAV
ncbi:DUF4386 domain-containing protein [Demequina capsici]|uniref:DUF4386 domain-containing protein n=1 Tax=Demequina capsici TaxID=3075620 RepID=A0AA96F7Y8_9MICO|nr:DUF4386 domain-containing protein [Demequina sp. OYTSA14]WNM25269.1 DUF4386 domain-containing protein [Demequina sp. OYTSA14]